MKRERGFTLLEITIAVALLAVSLVTLLGLEAQITQQTVTDRDRQRALLVARRILSAVEASEDPVEPGVKEASAREILQYFLASEDDRSSRRDTSLDLPVRLETDYFKIPGIENDKALKKSRLTVFWGPSEHDSLDVVFFTPDTEVEGEDVDEAKE